jgi:3-isopropylmalate/(R)-2-methylmalate dehydratase small subunit
MSGIIQGRAFVFGDDIDTDLLAPGALMKLPPDQLAQHCLSAIAPHFAKEVKQGDFVIAGRNFGLGSSREQAAVSLKILGVGAVIAGSFARIFYRNAINLGLPAITIPPDAVIHDGDRLTLDLAGGQLSNLTRQQTYQFGAIPSHLMTMMNDGGLIPHLKRRFAGHAKSRGVEQ